MTAVEMHDHVLIKMSDGVNLSARIWRPKTDEPVPALLEYLPYRKGDWTAPRDAQRHPWYAAHGYASVRVDMRGSGDSEGTMTDEYTEPYPGAAEVHLYPDDSELILPVRAADAPTEPVRFEPPEQAEPLDVVFHGASSRAEREVSYNPETGEWRLIVDPNYGGTRTYPDGLEFDTSTRETYAILAHDPASARCGSEWSIRIRRPDEDWDVGIDVSAQMSVDAGDFVTEHELCTTLNGEQVAHRTWTRRIPRSESLSP